MKVIISPQSFKGSLTGTAAAKAIEEGLRRVFRDADAVRIPVADGGDGTLEVLVENTGGQIFTSPVTGPLGLPVSAKWGVMKDGETAVIEMAQASGLTLVTPGRRDPRTTSTLGTGQLIKRALDKGYRRVIVGLGGSATNDGGMGMAHALGVRFLDRTGSALQPTGAALAHVASIDVSSIHMSIREAEIIAASDVTNPLCGPTGASQIYGPQKGASPSTITSLDNFLAHYALIIKETMGVDVANVPGSGAAGGLGAGLMAFANAQIRSGIDIVCEALDFEGSLHKAHLVITGEGRLDRSTAYNKAPIGVALRAKASGVPVLAMAGIVGEGYEAVYSHGITAVVCIVNRPMSIKESLKNTYSLLADATERAMKLLALPPPS